MTASPQTNTISPRSLQLLAACTHSPCALPVCRSTGSELCFSVLECDWNRFRIRKVDAVSSKENLATTFMHREKDKAK